MKKRHRAKPLSIKLDWKAYFRAFCEIHGREPVVIQGRLLFPDGWQYSLDNYEGPEYPPQSEEEAEALATVYWRRKQRIVYGEWVRLKRTLAQLELMRDTRSAPIQQKYLSYNDTAEGPRMGMVSCPVDFRAIRGRIDQLQADLNECLGHLRESSHAT